MKMKVMIYQTQQPIIFWINRYNWMQVTIQSTDVSTSVSLQCCDNIISFQLYNLD